MTASERMDKVADAAWLRLVARSAMAIFAVIGPLMLREGIYADDQQARALLTAAGLDPDEVLR